MKAETKRARMAALLGIELPKELSPREKLLRANVSREAEAVILYAENPTLFAKKFCRICQRDFAVNRSHIAFCSDDCRSVHINDVLGLEWSPTGRTPEERWAHQTGGQEPLIVPPSVLLMLEQLEPRVEPHVPQQQDDPEDDLLLPSLIDVDALLAE